MIPFPNHCLTPILVMEVWEKYGRIKKKRKEQTIWLLKIILLLRSIMKAYNICDVNSLLMVSQCECLKKIREKWACQRSEINAIVTERIGLLSCECVANDWRYFLFNIFDYLSFVLFIISYLSVSNWYLDKKWVDDIYIYIYIERERESFTH